MQSRAFGSLKPQGIVAVNEPIPRAQQLVDNYYIELTYLQ